jgi:hypothetical protein
MKSYVQIVNLLETIATDSDMLHHFAAGPLDQVDIEKLGQTNYPFLYCEILGVTVNNGVLSYDVELFVADMILPDLSNRTQTYSDTLQILHDVLNQFIQALATTNITVDDDYKMELPATLTPFTARFDNELTGWSGMFTIEVSNKNDLCIAPFS